MKQWLDKGDGGEWYEPYVTNKDLLTIAILTLIMSSTIIFGTYLINKL
jgi:hypothetical protein